MITSEKTDAILPKLLSLQRDLDVMVKNSENPHFRSGYVDLNDMLAEVKPKAQKLNLLLTQASRAKEQKLYMVSRLTDVDTGQWVESEWEMVIDKNTPHALGSSGTYARRYSLKGLMSLQEVDDDGNKASGKEKPVKNSSAPKSGPTNTPKEDVGTKGFEPSTKPSSGFGPKKTEDTKNKAVKGW